jgi:hypothetical protein
MQMPKIPQNEVVQLDTSEKEIFYSSSGEAPISVLIGMHAHPAANTVAGFVRIGELLEQIEPRPKVQQKICEGFIAEDGQSFPTAPDTIVIALVYPGQTGRTVSIKFFEESSTMH